MRDVLQQVHPCSSAHAGLAYDVWAPVETDGPHPSFKVPDDDRNPWLDWVCTRPVPDGYLAAFERWESSFEGDGVTWTARVTLASRLLIGHGNASPTEVGLTLHHTWGVPVIPGSALKGLTAHYVDTVYGGEQGDRRRYRGVLWDHSRIAEGPGDVYRDLFGAPDAEDGSTADQGCVIFHDALCIAGSGFHGRALAPDVLTVHQKNYYDHQGRDLPNDYDSPVPVAFLTVAPKTQFLVAVSGPEGWGQLALELLLEAMEQWGVGGKTSSGYGRIEVGARLVEPDCVPEAATQAFLEWLHGSHESQGSALAGVEERLPGLLELPAAQRRMVARAVAEAISTNRRTTERLSAVAQALEEGKIEPAEQYSAELQAFLDWLTGDGAALAAAQVLDVIEDDWFDRLDALDAAEKAHAIAALQQHCAGHGVDDRVRELEELLS